MNERGSLYEMMQRDIWDEHAKDMHYLAGNSWFDSKDLHFHFLIQRSRWAHLRYDWYHSPLEVRVLSTMVIG